MWNKLESRLKQRQAQDLIRQRLTLESGQDTEVSVNATHYVNFSSNDYLGLASHPKMAETMISAVKRYGPGSGASHLVVGHSKEHNLLEEELAEFVGTERAVLFSSGFMANYGVLTSLFDRKDLLVQDKLNHASLIDGGRASEAKMLRYAHNDLNSLQRQLKHQVDTKIIVTDGVFSMDGDLAPLPEILSLAESSQSQLMVDDAHGFGVLGESGKGSLEYFELEQGRVDIYMATLGKAIGGYGAFVAGKSTLIEALIQFARSYIYTTAIPPVVAAVNREGLRLVQSEPELRQNLQDNIQYFKQLAEEARLPLMPSDTAIQPLMVKKSDAAIRISQSLRDRGLLVVAIRPPTVPENTARLRITLTANHTKAHIEQLIEAIKDNIQVIP
ncbi:8-amino-7-oxononanoate synthase [Kangiella sediminilitoris]|uniref:8-amino-7-oxononanoate synthase n=1 Tax=Kangiella sediminilitoris TaxID=1144748 RepID=A0A1B3B8Q8_9GAMM|nr:8-amino-7-oxononanoate synthase [Kangiella sediminilitoris]AOE49182.1 8-amino-7-oxononanoate synthase [Kangiella sediminilitoris]